MATGTGRSTRSSRGRWGAVGNPGWGGRHARPGPVSRLVDRHRHRRRQPGTRWRRLRPVRSSHVPGERENNAYQHGADRRGESRPTAEPSRSRSPMHTISPLHGNGEYHHAEARRAASSEGNYSTHGESDRPATGQARTNPARTNPARTNPASTSVSKAARSPGPAGHVPQAGLVQRPGSNLGPLACTDPGRPAIDMIDHEGNRETITGQDTNG